MEDHALIGSLTAQQRALEDAYVQLRHTVNRQQELIDSLQGRLEEATTARAVLRGAPRPPQPQPPPRNDRPQHLRVVHGGTALALAGTLLRWGARARAHKVLTGAVTVAAVGTTAVVPSMITPAAPSPLMAEAAGTALIHPRHPAHNAAVPPLNIRTVHRRRKRAHASPAATPAPSPSPSPSPSPTDPDPSPSPTVTVTELPGIWAGLRLGPAIYHDPS